MDGGLELSNGAVVPMDVMENAVTEFTERLKDGPAPCFFTGATRDLANATHMVEEVSMDLDGISAEIAFLDTPKGNVMRKLMDIPGIKFEPSMHASCTTLEDGTVVVDEIQSIDSIDMCLFDVGKT